MKRIVVLYLLPIFVFLSITILSFIMNGQNVHAQNSITSKKYKTPRQELLSVPTITAYEAYVRYKRGQAIIIHAAGGYEKQHIIGAINLPTDHDLRKEKNIKMPRFPKKGVYLLTYCY